MEAKNEAAARVPPSIKHGAFWAPEGTVRAALALGLVAALIAVEASGVEAKQVGTLAGVAVTFYFTKRNGNTS